MVACAKPHIGDFFVRPSVVPTRRGRKPSHTKAFFQPSLRPHTDHEVHRYSVQAITDDTGAVVERYAYTAYGSWTILDAAGNPKAVQESMQPYGYTGRRYDAETDLWYFRARYFDSELGRFISRDPLGYIDGPSLYRGYLVPVLVDPFGLSMLPAHPRGEKFIEVIEETRWRIDRTTGKTTDWISTGIKPCRSWDIQFAYQYCDRGMCISCTRYMIKHQCEVEVKYPIDEEYQEQRTVTYTMVRWLSGKVFSSIGKGVGGAVGGVAGGPFGAGFGGIGGGKMGGSFGDALGVVIQMEISESAWKEVSGTRRDRVNKHKEADYREKIRHDLESDVRVHELSCAECRKYETLANGSHTQRVGND